MQNEINLYGSICIDKIDTNCIVTVNGKRYLNVVIRSNKEPSQYGDVAYIKQQAPKGAQLTIATPYIGNLKQSQFSYTQEPQQPREAQIFPEKKEKDMLPGSDTLPWD